MTTPRKIGGSSRWRHCYQGQEAKLTAILMEKGISIEQFNAYWDNVEQQKSNHELSQDEKDPAYRQEIARRVTRILQDAAADHSNAPHNTFVPTFAPQYNDMLKRGGTPGHSLEDPTRTGVWVPLHWLQSQTTPEPWKRLSNDELLTAYQYPTNLTAHEQHLIKTNPTQWTPTAIQSARKHQQMLIEIKRKNP